jgi:small-conductance mechanosensitive channel
MSDAIVTVTFGASTTDFEAGIASAREALASLAAPIADLNTKYAALGAALSESHTRAIQAIRSSDDAANSESLRAAQEAISGQIKAEQEGLKDKLTAYADDARNHRLSEDQKLQASREAIEETYALELDLLNRKRDLNQASLADRQRVDQQIAQAERAEQKQLAQLTREALDGQTQSYLKFGDIVAGAFNTQLLGLLSGTESWRDAFRKTLADLVLDFLESSDRMVVQWIAGEAAKTAATASQTASRTAVQQAGTSAALASQGASILRSILSSAAEAFAGVFGFLAPIMGPFAAGPAAAAQATVASAAGSVASADIGMWSVPADMLTLVHHNELVMPAAEAGAFRDLLTASAPRSERGGANVSLSPTTHFHVNAIDGGSVSQWMRANSAEMLRSINEAVRQGAHLGLRRLATS